MSSGIKPTDYQTQVKIFEAAGCTLARTQGDHLVYRFPGAKRPVVIPKYKEIPVFIIRKKIKGLFTSFSKSGLGLVGLGWRRKKDQMTDYQNLRSEPQRSELRKSELHKIKA